MTNDPREQRELQFSDALLTELSHGIDRSGGADPLAAMLLELREDVERPMPPAPQAQAPVIDLGARRGVRPLLAGLLGAAAATLVIAGSGAVLLNAGPGSPLYGLSTALFPHQDSAPDVVELASTLEEMNNLAQRGDMDGVRLLMEQARLMVRDMEETSRLAAERETGGQAPAPRSGDAPRGAAEATVTVTTTVPGAAPAQQPQGDEPRTQASQEAPAEPRPTVTETQTITVTATVTVPEPGGVAGEPAVAERAAEPGPGIAQPAQDASAGAEGQAEPATGEAAEQ
ncbi:hypothetical protein [Corynebacterium mastitidis]